MWIQKMSAKEISLVSSQNGLSSHSHPQLLFQDSNLRFTCAGAPPSRHRVFGDPNKATRELTGFIEDNHFSNSSATVTAAALFPTAAHHHQGQPPPSPPQDFPRSIYRRGPNDSDESEGEDDGVDDEDGEDDVDDDAMDGSEGDRDNSNNKNNNATGTSTGNANNFVTNAGTTPNSPTFEKLGNGNGKPKHHSAFGSGGELMLVNDGGDGMGQVGSNISGGVTIAEPDGEMYYSQYLQTTADACGGGVGGKDVGTVEDGCGFSGRKESSSFSSESGESLRAILSDPVTGVLMDDAVILPCGHSFGGGGIQTVIRMKSCYTCAHSISEDSIAPNLSLRAAVQAYRWEEEMQIYCSFKRRRERFDQDKGSHGDSTAMDPPRGRGVQYPFSVTDRIIIKGNKRTPQRFVGREAVVTTQCLNGWYVVKTLDNAESVKLQYRSLSKVSDERSSKAMPTEMVSNWL